MRAAVKLFLMALSAYFKQLDGPIAANLSLQRPHYVTCSLRQLDFLNNSWKKYKRAINNWVVFVYKLSFDYNSWVAERTNCVLLNRFDSRRVKSYFCTLNFPIYFHYFSSCQLNCLIKASLGRNVSFTDSFLWFNKKKHYDVCFFCFPHGTNFVWPGT